MYLLLYNSHISDYKFAAIFFVCFVYSVSHIHQYVPFIARSQTRTSCKFFVICQMVVPSKLHANLKLRFFFLPGKFWSSPRSISTHKLHALLHFHLEPINHVVFMGSYSLRMGNLILRVASCLDAFSTYPFRT